MRLWVAISAILVLGACVGPYPSSLVQQGEPLERRLLQCQQQLGIGGALQTEVSMADGQVTAIALPFDQVDAAAADRINACANGAIVLDDGMVVEPMVEGAWVAPQPVGTSNRIVTSTGCPPGANGLYRGTLICGGGL